MDDIYINLVKNNQHYIKTPFKGKIIRLLVRENDEVGIDESVAVLKTDKFYIEVESEYPGTVKCIGVNEGDIVDRWDGLMVVDVKSNYEDAGLSDLKVNSKSYNLIYSFQQSVLPGYFYSKKSFLSEISEKKEKLIIDLIKEHADNQNLINPIGMGDLSVDIEDVDGNSVVQLFWPDLKSPLLAKRTYFVINPQSGKRQYFTCEKSLENELMISSIVEHEGGLTRYNYGGSPDDVDIEKERIIGFFQ